MTRADNHADRPVRVRGLVLTYLRAGVMAEMQYRVNFVVSLVRSLIAVGTALVVLGLVYSHTDDLAGWSSSELLVVMGVYLMMAAVIRAGVQPNMTQLMEDVETGTLDHVLTRPVDAQVLVSLRRFDIWQAMDIPVGLAIVVVGLVRIGTPVGVWPVAAFALTLLLGAVDVYCFWLILTSSAFFLIRVGFLVELFDGMFQAGRWPVTIYPGWLRAGFTFLVPLAFAVTVPASTVTGRLTGWIVGGAALFTVVLLVLARWVWTRSVRRYSGASA